MDNFKPKCFRCGNILHLHDSETGEIVCVSCGCVLSEHTIDTSTEWRSFNDKDNNKKRTGSNLSLTQHDMGLSTIINPKNNDVTGKPLSSSMCSTIKRLRIWDKRTHSKSTDKNFIQAFTELGRIKESLNVSDAVTEKAAYIYRKAIELGLVNGRSISVLIAASMYAACRYTKTPRTVNDIHNVTNIGKRKIQKTYRILLQELDLKMPVVDPVNCVIRIANNVGVSEKTKRFAIGILRKAKQHNISHGKDPNGLAAAALYMACIKMKEVFSQRHIAEVANITVITIRSRTRGFQILEKNS